MAKCSLDIKKDIIDDVANRLTQKGAVVQNEVGYFPNPSKATEAISSVNNEFGERVISEGQQGSFIIQPSPSLVQEYLEEYNKTRRPSPQEEAFNLQQEEMARGGYTEEQRGEFFQAKDLFNSMSQIEKDLGAINKTAASIGSVDKIDKVLKKAGMSPELRNQFLEILNKNPQLKNIKLSTVLSTFVRESAKDSDRAYYEAIDKPLSKELEKTLIDYFDRFHIRREEINNLKEKFDVDSVGVFDVLAKTIYYAKNRNLLTLPEEYGHVFVELLGSISNKKANNPLFTYLFNNIENWDGYKRVFDQYKNIYVTKEGNYDIYKIKKEAIGQAIGIALVRNYKNNKAANKTLWEKLISNDTTFWTKIQEAIDHIADLLKGISYANINVEVDNIAKDILNKNYSKLDRLQKDTSNYNLLSYAETIENQNKKDGGRALQFMQWFSNIGNIITGSLAYRFQGNTYRPEIDALHDIDMIVPSDVHNIDLNKSSYLTAEQLENNRLYLKYTSEGNHKEAKKYKQSGNIKLNIDDMIQNEYFKKIKEKYPDLDFLYTFYNQKANAYYITVNAIWSENQELKDKFKSLTGNFNDRLSHFTLNELDQIYLFDFFLRPETTEEYTTIQEPQYNLNLAHFNYAFYEKLNMMGRAKDAYDYQNWQYFDKENILAPDFNDRMVYFQLQKSEENKPMLQTEEMPMSKASSETIEKVKGILEKAGVKIKDLLEYAKSKGINVKGANGLADLTTGIIAIAEGKEDVALTEEFVHMARAIYEQKNPEKVTEMISKIERFKIYKQVYEAYKDKYVLPNGKPDIRKIKMEAVDKLIAEVVINQNEGSTEFPELMEETNRSLIRNWWNSIIDWFKGMARKNNIDVFQETAKVIGNELDGTVADIKESGIYLQTVTDEQQKTLDRITAEQRKITKVPGDNTKVDPILMDTEEASNSYVRETEEGETVKIKKRVTDRVKAWYAKRFPDKKFTEKEKAFNELKREMGIMGHLFFEEIHSRYFNPDGTKKAKVDSRKAKRNLVEERMYTELETYFKDIVKSLPKDTLFLSEVMIYDAKEDEAGTIDLLAIEPSGKAHILDWKFMNVPENATDVAWFKQNAYGIQLGRYKEILKERYGIKQFGMTRAIPILMDFSKAGIKKDSPMRLSGIVIGSADSRQITDLRLMPVSEETESTGIDKLDNLIKKLNAILTQVGKEKTTTEGEFEFKVERLNVLREAIRTAQGTLNIEPLVRVIRTLRQDGANILNDYNVIYKDLEATTDSINDKDISNFQQEMRNFVDVAKAFEYIDTMIGSLIYNKEMDQMAKTRAEKKDLEERKRLRDDLREEIREITETRIEIEGINPAEGIMTKFADKFTGQRNLVEGLGKPERIVKGFFSRFKGVSEIGTAALDILYKLTSLAKSKAARESLGEVEELMKIREKIVAKGGNMRSILHKLYQKDDKGGIVNKLIYKYKKEFYEAVKDLSGEKGDRQWLMDNINIEEYQKEALEEMNSQIEVIKKKNYGAATEAENREIRDEKIIEQRRKWDITRKDFNGWNNSIIKRHPIEKWHSDEFKEIEKDKDLLELYNFIVKFNRKAKDVGYISGKISSTFLPFIRKTMAEGLSWDYSLSALNNFSNNLKMKMDDVGYGEFNELTGELENSIPKYYTRDFTYKDGVNDFSEVSEEIFKNLILYIQHVNKYKFLSDIEEQIKTVKTIEESKGHLATNSSGEIVQGDNRVIAGNEDNAKLFTNFMRVLLYDQKYVLSDEDVPLYINKVLNPIKKIVNGITKPIIGRDLWKEGDESSASSMIKTLDAANKGFQLKTLGLDVIPGTVNWFGGNMQVLTQAGEYFSGKDYIRNHSKLFHTIFTGDRLMSDEERETYIQLINVFMPLKDDPTYDLYKEAGLTKLTRTNAGDTLMVFMRRPEQVIEKSIFLSLLDNMMVDNGKIISIKEYVKNKYKDRDQSAAKYKEAAANMKSEIEELKKTRSISATKKLEDGKLVIPGLNLNNFNEIQRLTSLTRRISRNATGGLSDSDINLMSMSIWTKSMMLFKGWIPKLTATRFSTFKKTNDDFSIKVNDEGEFEGYKYDVGRLRVLAYFMNLNIFKTISRINDTISMNEDGMADLTKMFEKYKENYEKRTGEPLQMDKAEFVDMIRQHLANQLRELGVLASLTGALFALGFMAPPPDADKDTKNAFRYAQKILGKFQDELGFFYNPINYENLLNGSLFPAMGIITDFQKFTTNLWLETTGLDLSNPTKSFDDVVKDAHPIKYLMKMLPVTKSVLIYLAMIDADFAKEMDVTIQKEGSHK